MSKKPKATSSKSSKTATGRERKETSRLEYEMKELDSMSYDIKKPKELSYKLATKFKNGKQKELYNAILDKSNRIIFVKGSAGTGKTFVTLMAALQILKDIETQNINKVLISKIAVESSKSTLGLLPGTMEEKMAPYFDSFWSNISKLVGPAWTKLLKESKTIEESMINFMRGSTFGSLDENGNPIGTLVIMDECQNTTVNECKTLLSRLGEGSRIICLGDSDQVDIKLTGKEKNGLDDAFERFKDLKGVQFFEFTEDDIVRDPFLIEIMKRYKNQ